MKKNVFIDGREGTTGLRIFERLAGRDDVEMLVLPEETRKDPTARKEMLRKADVAFLCLPDDAARESVALAEGSDVTIIDTSTAHRTAAGWVYGFPELFAGQAEKIAKAKRIAVPGCHASGFISLVSPLVEAGILPKDAFLTCHSITGYSGGGKKMIAQYEAEGRDVALDSPRQYGITQTHKHLPEMKVICKLDNAPIFCPIVADYYSGMTVTVPLFAGQINGTAEDIKALYRKQYNGGLVSYDESITDSNFIAANTLSGIDTMKIAVTGNADRILLVSHFDNLGKGASGAAVECLNLVFGKDMGFGLKV